MPTFALNINYRMFNFISFGSGSSGNCYLLYTDTDALMIDAGIGMRELKKRFANYGLKLSDVHNIIVTHDHADHVKAVGCISHDYDLPIYATPKVHKGIKGNYCVRHKPDADHCLYTEKGRTEQIGEFSVTPFNVPHDSADNVGYKVVHDGVTFCLITDVGEVTDEIKQYIAQADYLVMEANHDEQMLQNGNYPQYLKERIRGSKGHLSNKACGEALAECASEKLKKVWLCHLSEENNHPELARKTVEGILAEHGIVVGKDLELIVLKRTTPSEIYELK